MRIGGEEISGLNEDVLVLPRGAGKSIKFHGKAIHDFDEFDKMVPVPEAPKVLTKNGPVTDVKDEGFKGQRLAYELIRFAYMVIKTLEPSNIEWSTVKFDDPSTWNNWADELAQVLSIFEQRQLIDFVHEINSLSQGKIDEARRDFLAGLAQVKA